MSEQLFPHFKALKVTQLPEGDILLAQLHRPEVRNAIDHTMVTELHELCADLEENPRILIITGCTTEKGRGIFASGADIAQLKQRTYQDALRGINNMIFQRIAELPLPVIAAVDGFALGGGLELALAADFRVATAQAQFGQPEAGLGIMAAAGGTWRLRAAVGQTLAREILLAGRILSGEEALEHHLVSSLHEPARLLDAAVTLAQKIAKHDPLAIQITKSVLAMPESAHPHVDNIAQAILFESPAKHQRMQAFLDRRKK